MATLGVTDHHQHECLLAGFQSEQIAFGDGVRQSAPCRRMPSALSMGSGLTRAFYSAGSFHPLPFLDAANKNVTHTQLSGEPLFALSDDVRINLAPSPM